MDASFVSSIMWFSNFFPRDGYDQMRFFRWLWSLESEAQKSAGFFQKKHKEKMLSFLPQSWNWKMTLNERKLLSEGHIFHFHDYGQEEWEALELGILEAIIVFLCCLNALQGWFCGLQLAPVFEELQRGQLKKHWQVSVRSRRFVDAKKKPWQIQWRWPNDGKKTRRQFFCMENWENGDFLRVLQNWMVNFHQKNRNHWLFGTWALMLWIKGLWNHLHSCVFAWNLYYDEFSSWKAEMVVFS